MVFAFGMVQALYNNLIISVAQLKSNKLAKDVGASTDIQRARQENDMLNNELALRL